MKLKISIIITILLILIGGFRYCSGQTSVSNLKEGDMIFHTSKSDQSSAIQYATTSVLSHCGIVIEKGNDLYVLEASSTLKLTPLDTFIARGKNGQWWAKRVIDKPIKIKYKHLLGRKYDSAFKPNNSLFYCSELIHYVYKEQFGIELCKFRKVKSYNTIGLKEILKKRHISLEQEVVAPIDIYDSEYAHNI